MRVWALVREVCRTNEVEILEGAVSPSKLMQYVKGNSSQKLMAKFRHLQKQYWGRHFWASGYFVASPAVM